MGVTSGSRGRGAACGSSRVGASGVQRRRATRLEVRRATLRDPNISCSCRRGGCDLCRLASGLGGVKLARLLAGEQADPDEVERADEAVADAVTARARAIASRAGTAQWCSSRISAAAE